jgi:hypothetical protein
MADAVPRAFFSYSRQDSEFVLKLARDLREGGAEVWLDQLDIEPGQRWDTAVEQALASCPRMLLVLSPSSVDSTNVMDEVSFGLEERRLIIPVLYRDCKIPFRLRRVQYIDVRTDYQRGLQDLLRMLDARPAVPHSAAVNTVAAPTLAEEPQVEIARITREREETAATKAREKAERERIEREQAHAARISRKQEDVAARAAEPQAAQRPAVAATTALEPAPSGSRRKLIIGGCAAVVVLGGAIVVWKISKPGEAPSGPTTVPPAPKDTPLPAEVTSEPPAKPKRPAPRVGVAWLTRFMEASQGPSTEALRPYFHDTVAPYYGMPSADWAAIEKDKKRYFSRFPRVRLTVVGDPQITTTEQGDVVNVTVEYENTRNDGQRTTGTSHVTMTVSSVDGAWKIVGIQERIEKP